MILNDPERTGDVTAVRGRVRRAGWTRLTHGIYRPGPGDVAARDLAGDLRAWQLVLPPEGAFTHLTAARLLGWWLPPEPVQAPLFSAIPADSTRPRRPGLLVSRHRGRQVAREVEGVRIADYAEIVLEAARDLSLLDLVVLVDSAVSSRLVSLHELRAVADGRRRGAPSLRRALGFADPRSESAWESVARVLHSLADIPVEPQYVVRDDTGLFVARADLRIVGTRRLHEYDGGVHRTVAQHAKDLDRDRRVQLIGWQRFGYTAHRLLYQGATVIRDADLALDRRWDPARLQRWNAAVRASAYSAAGRQRLADRWARAFGPARRR